MEWTLLVAMVRGDEGFDVAASIMGWESGAELLDTEMRNMAATEEELKSMYIQLQDQDGDQEGPQPGDDLQLIGEVTIMNVMGDVGGNQWYPDTQVAFKDKTGNVWYLGDGSF